MHFSFRMKRRFFPVLGAAALVAAGVLSFTWFSGPISAMQAGAARESVRMPDGTEFPSWERPLQFSKTYYVDGSSSGADDSGPGTKERPFRTIGKAAEVLQPGERVVIGEGVYREVVRPQRGGTGPDQMISYEAAEGANVVVRGSAVVKDGWTQSQGIRRWGRRNPRRTRRAGADMGGGSRRQPVRRIQSLRHDEHAAAAVAVHEPHEHQCPQCSCAVHARARHAVCRR